MKNLCFLLAQLFQFKKKKQQNHYQLLNDNSIELSNLSTFNLEKHDNVYHKYKPPPILISQDPEFETSSSDEDDLFQSYSPNFNLKKSKKKHK